MDTSAARSSSAHSTRARARPHRPRGFFALRSPRAHVVEHARGGDPHLARARATRRRVPPPLLGDHAGRASAADGPTRPHMAGGYGGGVGNGEVRRRARTSRARPRARRHRERPRGERDRARVHHLASRTRSVVPRGRRDSSIIVVVVVENAIETANRRNVRGGRFARGHVPDVRGRAPADVERRLVAERGPRGL